MLGFVSLAIVVFGSVLGAVLGAIVGLVSPFAVVYLVFFSRFSSHILQTNGPWRFNPLVGSSAADMYTRAVISIVGLLALSKDEAVYYNAVSDSSGRPLHRGASYRVTIKLPLPCYWWSITAYGSDSYMIDNPAHIYSLNSTSAIPSPDDENFIVLYLGPRAPPHADNERVNWIPTGSPDLAPTDTSRFNLTMRLYLPALEATTRQGFKALQLPRIERLSSDGM